MTVPPKTPRPVVEASPAADPDPPPTRSALAQRIRQQEILAALGVTALRGMPFDDLLDETARRTAEALEAEFCKVLEYLPAEKRLLVRAGVGWGPDVIGKATVGADLESPAGYALHTGKPVISNHLQDEQRFRTPDLLARAGVRRAMNVILQGEGAPFGVLEVDSRSDGEFGEHDIAFLQGAANILGMALERQRFERNLTAALERQSLLMKEVNHRIKNSLQLAVSMLQLQAGAAKEKGVKAQLGVAASRILTIARAHQQLYKNDHVETLDLSAYLGDVCRDLGGGATACTVDFDGVPGIAIATDRAIPIALAVTELVTNVAKYAYPEAADKRAWVRVARAGDGADAADRIVISVADDGAGLPRGFDIARSKGLGMRIVAAFASQIGAALAVHRRSPGTEFTLELPLNPPR